MASNKGLWMTRIHYVTLLLASLILSSCGHMFYYPSDMQVNTPGQFNLLYEDYFFKTKDGEVLHSWKIFARQKEAPKGTIIFFHGNAENITTHFMHLAWITEKGYDLFIFDYRGYGKSTGSPDQPGLYLDGLAGINEGVKWAVSRNSKKVVVYGQSLGGVVAARSLMDYPRKHEVNLLVMDSTFSSYQKIAAGKMKDKWFTYIFFPFAYLFVSDKTEIESKIPTFYMPKLIIHGEFDKIVPYRFGEELHRISASPKWFWKIEQGYHSDIFFNKSDDYRMKFLKFLKTEI
jgi:fermentation-respiration switch protein FrsA (DUF1100 family)